MKEKNNNLAIPVVEVQIYYFYTIAKSFLDSAELLSEQKDDSKHLSSFHLLVSMTFEIFIKILIACDIYLSYKLNCKSDERYIEKKIKERLKNKGHSLKELFEYGDLLKRLKIKYICEMSDNQKISDFVNGYNLKMENKDLLHIKNIEGVRYGFFAGKKNVVLDYYNSGKILDLLYELEKIVQEKHQETIKKIRGSM